MQRHGLSSLALHLMTHSLMLIDVLERRVRSEPDSSTFDRRPLSTLRADALRVASALRERELCGKPVLVALPAGADYVTCLLGCLYAGAIAVPAYPPSAVRLSRANQRIASILRDAGVSCALTSGDAIGTALPIETLRLETLIATNTLARPEMTWSLDPDAVCLVQYTSGSTSSPKGVAVSLRQLSANLAAMSDATQVTSSDVLVTWLPPYHDMGLLGGILGPLFAGVATHILSPEAFLRSPLRWLQAITERRATVTMAPNFAFDLCVRRIPEAHRRALDLTSLRVLFNGAEPIQADTLEAFAAAFAASGFDPRAFYPCYGLAEATLFVAGGRPEAPPVVEVLDATALEQHRAERATSAGRVTRVVGCGRAATATCVRIVDPDSQMRVSDGQVGEIWVSGAAVATGYWNRPDETQERFQAWIGGSSEGPFLRTGDLGFVMDDELFVTGRLKELIVIRGQNHYPHDIERTVQAIHPAFGTQIGAAFSVDLDGQERVVVVHEIDPRQRASAAVLISGVLEAVRQLHGLSLHACVIVKRGSVARTASGKVQRQSMRRAYLDGALDVVARWDASVRTREPSALQAETGRERDRTVTRPQPAGATERRDAIADFLRDRIAQIAQIEPDEIDEHAPLARYGVDSLHAAELTHALEQFVGEALPATISYEQPTIAALARALSASSAPVVIRAPRETRDRSVVDHRGAIAIVGMSCRFPGAPNLESFWDLLANGRDAVSELPLDRPQLVASGARFGGFIDGIDRFDPAFFGISAREAARLDPQQRLFLELTWAALEDAGIPPSTLRETDAGVFAAVCTSDYALLHAGHLSLIDADYGAGHAQSVVANRVSYTLDLRGPSMTVDTACSSALVALHLASESLRRGECSVALVGGVNAVLAAEPGLFFARARALAKDGRCKTFDASADGFVRSEGCGVIVLKRGPDAEAAGDRIYAQLVGSAMNHDGRSNGLTTPSLPAQERLLRAALAAADVTPEQVEYVEAHGVGTPVSDAVELGALGRVLGRSDGSPCHVGSVKTNLGHLEAASGIAGVIKTALALTYERIPAHLHLRQISADVDFERLGLAIPTRTLPWPRSRRPRFAGVSAFGFGGTNAHVVLRESPRRPASIGGAARRFELLALSAKDPAALREIAAELASRVTDATLSALCFSMNAGRDHFAYRAAVVASGLSEMRAGLQRIADGNPTFARRSEPRIAFVFNHHTPSAGAARELYAAEPVFRRALERGSRIVEPVLDADPLPALLAAECAPRLEFPQTSAVLLQYALQALLEHWRIAPAIVFGCGAGEYAAAGLAGALGWQDALRLAARRELVLASLVPGARVRQTLFQFKTALATAEYAPPSMPLLAAGLGRLVATDETLDRKYWLEHLYAVPDAERGVAALQRATPQITLDVAADGCDYLGLLQTVAMLYEHGVSLDFRAFHSGFEREKLGLPGYPFQRQRCWLDVAPAPAKPEATPASVHPFLQPRPAESRQR